MWWRVVELEDKRSYIYVQFCTERTQGIYPPKVDFCSEPTTRVQRAILEAEKNKDSDVKNQPLSFLGYFEIGQECFRKQDQQEKWEVKL
jgi:hypothetical protein